MTSSRHFRRLLNEIIAGLGRHPITKNKTEWKKGFASAYISALGASGGPAMGAEAEEEVARSEDNLISADSRFTAEAERGAQEPVEQNAEEEEQLARLWALLDGPGVPQQMGLVSRLQAGQVLRAAGPNYHYSLYLAVVQLARELFVHRALSNTPDRSLPTMITRNTTTTAALEQILQDFKILSRIRDDVEEEPAPTPSTHPQPGIVDRAHAAQLLSFDATYRADLFRVLQAAGFILDAVKDFQLEGVWDLAPLVSVNQILQTFPKVPVGPVIAEVKCLLVQGFHIFLFCLCCIALCCIVLCFVLFCFELYDFI